MKVKIYELNTTETIIKAFKHLFQVLLMKLWTSVEVMAVAMQRQDERKLQVQLSAVTQLYMCAGTGTPALACVIS